MLKNKEIKKTRLLKIAVYLLRELPVNKPKVMNWFEDFIRRNRERLIGVDIGRYVDVHTINPVPIDYNKLTKNAVVKAKNLEKDREREKRKEQEREKEKEKNKEKEMGNEGGNDKKNGSGTVTPGMTADCGAGISVQNYLKGTN
jgi:hypothetical protein